MAKIRYRPVSDGYVAMGRSLVAHDEDQEERPRTSVVKQPTARPVTRLRKEIYMEDQGVRRANTDEPVNLRIHHKHSIDWLALATNKVTWLLAAGVTLAALGLFVGKPQYEAFQDRYNHGPYGTASLAITEEGKPYTMIAYCGGGKLSVMRLDEKGQAVKGYIPNWYAGDQDRHSVEMQAIDYNGDGYKDVVVSAKGSQFLLLYDPKAHEFKWSYQ